MSKNNIKIAGVVVWYNPEDKVKNNIFNYLDEIDKLYIVDNSDGKNTIDSNKKIVYIHKNKNLGIAKALNIGAKNAIEDGYKWILTMDQDSILEKESLVKMKEYIQSCDKNVGIVSPYHVCKNINFKTNGESVEEKLDVMTSGNLLNLEIYKKVGDFLDWMFIDCVDTEYCLRLNKLGFKVIRLNNIKMKHYLGSQTVHHLFKKVMYCSNYSPMRRYYQIRNNLYLRDMYKDVFPERCSDCIDNQKGELRRVLLFEKNKIKKLKSMYKGYKDYKKGIK